MTEAQQLLHIAETAHTDSILSAATGDPDAAEYQRDLADELTELATQPAA